MLNKCVAVLLLAGGIALAADKPPSDAAIADTVLIRLSADREVNGGALKVDVRSGIATITGVVETQRQKDKLPKIAKKVRGVKQVVNNVTLKERAAGK
jgi:osmotically-inducible protein OsmY